jgi:hypothetical protein
MKIKNGQNSDETLERVRAANSRMQRAEIAGLNRAPVDVEADLRAVSL